MRKKINPALLVFLALVIIFTVIRVGGVHKRAVKDYENAAFNDEWAWNMNHQEDHAPYPGYSEEEPSFISSVAATILYSLPAAVIISSVVEVVYLINNRKQIREENKRQTRCKTGTIVKRQPLELVFFTAFCGFAIFRLLVVILDPILIRILPKDKDFTFIGWTVLALSLFVGFALSVMALKFVHSGRCAAFLRSILRKLRDLCQRISDSYFFTKLRSSRLYKTVEGLMIRLINGITYLITERTDILTSLLAFGLALRTLWVFFGIGSTLEEVATSMVLSMLLNLDFEVLLWGLPAALLSNRIRGTADDWHGLGRKAFYISVACVVLSFTMVGDVAAGIGYSVTQAFRGGF